MDLPNIDLLAVGSFLGVVIVIGLVWLFYFDLLDKEF